MKYILRIGLIVMLMAAMLLCAIPVYAEGPIDDPGPDMPLEDPPPGWQVQKISVLIWQLRMERLWQQDCLVSS